MFPFPFALFSKAGPLSQIYKFRVGHERVFFGSFLTLSEGLVGVLSWSWRRKRFNTETRRHRVLNISVSLSLSALARGLAAASQFASLTQPYAFRRRRIPLGVFASLQVANPLKGRLPPPYRFIRVAIRRRQGFGGQVCLIGSFLSFQFHDLKLINLPLICLGLRW